MKLIDLPVLKKFARRAALGAVAAGLGWVAGHAIPGIDPTLAAIASVAAAGLLTDIRRELDNAPVQGGSGGY